jgi:carnitine O-palmitoyltransferase 1
MHRYRNDDIGKGLAKKHSVSPDAFIQMTLQLAYFYDIGKHDWTYEPAMTRLFREGRTETIRSCSIESCKWIKSMVDKNFTNKERSRLFKDACDSHQQQHRDAMTGKVDVSSDFCFDKIFSFN